MVVSDDVREPIVNGNSLSNYMIMNLILAGLVANDLDINEIHGVLMNNADQTLKYDNSLPDLLKMPFMHTRFMLDHIERTQGDGYQFFFSVDQLSMTSLLNFAREGVQVLHDGMENSLYVDDDLTKFYDSVFEIYHSIMDSLPNKNVQCLAILAAFMKTVGEIDGTEDQS